MSDDGDIRDKSASAQTDPTEALCVAIGADDVTASVLIARMEAAGVPARRAGEEINAWHHHGLLVRVRGTHALRASALVRLAPDAEQTGKMQAELAKMPEGHPVLRTELELSDEEIEMLAQEGVIEVARPISTGKVFVIAHAGVPRWTAADLHDHLWGEQPVDPANDQPPTRQQDDAPTRGELLDAGPPRGQLRLLRDRFALDVFAAPREVAKQAIEITAPLIFWGNDGELVFPSRDGQEPRSLGAGPGQSGLRKAVEALRKDGRALPGGPSRST